ncbi:MAG TPA: hypothetical protein VIJ41_17520 [Candidatus Nanopelagicales bacterium]|jgi:hypothetical protein
MGLAHEHSFYDHADPRYVVCDCGQYAVRRRTATGQFDTRLVDPPRRSFGDAAAAENERLRASAREVTSV